jgi:hypothetical protein
MATGDLRQKFSGTRDNLLERPSPAEAAPASRPTAGCLQFDH